MKGVIRAGALVSVVAAATNTIVYNPSTANSVTAGNVGVAGGVSYVINRIMLYYGGATATVYVRFGELVAAVFTPRIPMVELPRGFHMNMGQGSWEPIPRFTFFSTLYVQVTDVAEVAGAVNIGAAPIDCKVLVEVIEYPMLIEG